MTTPALNPYLAISRSWTGIFYGMPCLLAPDARQGTTPLTGVFTPAAPTAAGVASLQSASAGNTIYNRYKITIYIKYIYIYIFHLIYMYSCII